MPRLRHLSRSARHRLLVLAVSIAGAYLVGLLSPVVFGLTAGIYAHPSAKGSGVITFDEARTDTGYVTVGVISDQTVKLVAKDGRVIHAWHLNYPLAGTSTMYPDGSLLYLGTAPPPASGPPPPFLAGRAGILERLSWDGTVTWSFEDAFTTHDFTELPDGTLAVLRLSVLSTGFASRVPGGAPGTELNGQMWGDEIVEIDPVTKQEKVVFDIATAWRPEDHPLPAFMPRSEWTHANGIFFTPSDPVSHQPAYLISFRDVSTVLLVSRASGAIIWSYGGDWALDQQHDPTLLPNGHVLLFDNGQYRQNAVSASRLLEIDPLTNEVVWSYSGYGIVGTNFYSPITGGAERLPNGNTLATLGTKGQLMEVTPDKAVVWDYRERSGPVDPAYPVEHLNFLFKSRSYPASEVEPLLAGG